MTMSAFKARVERNRSTVRGSGFRRGLLALVPSFWAITVVARLFEGVGLPQALWDLGPHAGTFLSMSCFVVLLAAAHWLWFRRT